MYIKGIKIKSFIKKAAAAALSFLLVFGFISNTFAWFEKEDRSDVTIDFSSMKMASRVYFEYKDAGNNVVKYEPGHDGYGFYRAEVVESQSGAENFYANLRIDILFKGKGANYIRVYIAEEWVEYDAQSQEEVITRNVFTQFLFADSLWIDNRKSGANDIINDGYFYYNDINASVNPYEISYAPAGPDDYKVIQLITGINPEWMARQTYDPDTYLKIKVLSEAVQVNRYREIWQRNDLPKRQP